MSTTDDNKALVLRFYELVINQHKIEAIDGLLSNVFVHNGEKRGTKGQREAIEVLFAAMPDIRVITESAIAEGDMVAVRQTWTGTHEGPFLGIAPTGKTVSFTSMAMLRLAEGKIVAAWVNEDDLGLMRQLESAEPLA